MAREEHRGTSEGAGPSRAITSDARTTIVSASPTTARMQLPQGACLAWRRGTSGEEPWHGESRKGSSPDYLLTVRAAVLMTLSQGCGDGTSLRLRLLCFRHIQRRPEPCADRRSGH